MKVRLMNKISQEGLKRLPADRYEVGEDLDHADAIMVRSASLHDAAFEPELKCIARAGAGVNNIPLDRCSEQGIVVFNTPGGNSNAVKELTIAGLLLASRKIVKGIEWVKTLDPEGIAKTVKALCDAVQLPCIVALSEAAPERGVKYRHTWNVITVDGQRYHLDATFDNSLQRGTPRYDYFNLDDRHIFRDHETLVLPLPPCTADKGYYYRPLSFTKPEDVENRARQALRKKQPHFVFHWRGGGLNREILTDLLNRCAAAAAERGKCVSCSVNTAQAVVQLDFTDAPAGEALLVQQPDEGNEL